MAKKHGQNRIDIMQLFLENPEKILTTQAITETTGINKSVVSRELKVLTQLLQVKKIKAGHYQLVSRELSGKWTKDDNIAVINRLLDFYDSCLPVWCLWLKQYCAKGEFDTAVKMLKSMTDTLDILLHRWAILNKGYDANPEQARQDVKLAKALEPPPEEPEEDNEIRHWDAVNKKFID